MSEITSHLQRLRAYRGRDDAVKIVGDRTNLVNLLRDSKNHKRNEITHEVVACYSGSAYGDANWTKSYCAWGDRPEMITIHGIFARNNPELLQLNLDPGVITHLPEFVEFLRSQSHDNYLIARESFKKHLGSRTVWRGMVLTDEEADRVRHEGIESSFLRKSEEMQSVIENFEANVLSVYFDQIVERHFYAENYWSPLISVSSHRDIAIAVGRHSGRNKVKEGGSLYLFKIEIPEIDLIYFTEHAVRWPSKMQDAVRNGNKIHVAINDAKSSFNWDRHAESYVMYKINPDEIADVFKTNLTATSWNGHISK